MDDEGRSLHVKQLIGLQHWARPLALQTKLDDGHLTFHVLEASDPLRELSRAFHVLPLPALEVHRVREKVALLRIAAVVRKHEVVAEMTSHPAKEIRREDLGNLSVGSVADVAVLRAGKPRKTSLVWKRRPVLKRWLDVEPLPKLV